MRFLRLARESSASSRKACSALLGVVLLGCQARSHEPSDPSAGDLSDPTAEDMSNPGDQRDEAARGPSQADQGGASSSKPGELTGSIAVHADASVTTSEAGALPPKDQALLPARASQQLPGSTVSGKDGCVTWTGNLAGYRVRAFSELINQPRADEPYYAYLVSGKDAVELQGPTLLAQDPVDTGAYKLAALSARVIDPPTLYPDWSRDIHEVTLEGPKGLLRYVVHGDDLEGEVTLARVWLCRSAGELTSRFVFAAAPDAGGVAHNLTIHALLDATPLRATAPVSIEVRPQ
jgi:hypothetical protein